ncbi:HET-domain-containing protein [Penicillium malachiteum]|nr:HET-domain-containing protein [Penicillium malachiteum]
MASDLEVDSRESALCDLLLIWDWNDTTRDLEDMLLYETSMKNRGSEFVETSPSCHSDSAKRALNMTLALEKAKQWGPAEERLAES